MPWARELGGPAGMNVCPHDAPTPRSFASVRLGLQWSGWAGVGRGIVGSSNFSSEVPEQLTEMDSAAPMNSFVPLSKLMAEQIDGLRKWPSPTRCPGVLPGLASKRKIRPPLPLGAHEKLQPINRLPAPRHRHSMPAPRRRHLLPPSRLGPNHQSPRLAPLPRLLNPQSAFDCTQKFAFETTRR